MATDRRGAVVDRRHSFDRVKNAIKAVYEKFGATLFWRVNLDSSEKCTCEYIIDTGGLFPAFGQEGYRTINDYLCDDATRNRIMTAIVDTFVTGEITEIQYMTTTPGYLSKRVAKFYKHDDKFVIALVKEISSVDKRRLSVCE